MSRCWRLKRDATLVTIQQDRLFVRVFDTISGMMVMHEIRGEGAASVRQCAMAGMHHVRHDLSCHCYCQRCVGQSAPSVEAWGCFPAVDRVLMLGKQRACLGDKRVMMVDIDNTQVKLGSEKHIGTVTMMK